ncbi:hypothetical protein FHR81_003404 [Actinoalloteichus hoggarensis]|nr:hypothetical protein [Actinoalloteichus hoggarensis]MBB5922352.1 hypothetical protein [Actinoalloteichus hoggarensis]
MTLGRPENALLGFRHSDHHIDARIVWHDPAMATALDEIDEGDEPAVV